MDGSQLMQGLVISFKGFFTVFIVLIVFYFVIKILQAAFPEKGDAK
jgi:Na+-transporting methylmalonyl-CoA/oxaloacetate decarboxylase gamma subunit